MRSSILLPAGLLLSALTGPAAAQDRGDEEPFLPGLVATYDNAQGAQAVRVDRQLAFRWAGAAPDPRLHAGAFCATWKGRLNVDAAGEYRFCLVGDGEAELRVAGRVVLPRQRLHESGTEAPPVALTAELQPFELAYWYSGTDARLALFWSATHVLREPV